MNFKRSSFLLLSYYSLYVVFMVINLSNNEWISKSAVIFSKPIHFSFGLFNGCAKSKVSPIECKPFYG